MAARTAGAAPPRQRPSAAAGARLSQAHLRRSRGERRSLPPPRPREGPGPGPAPHSAPAPASARHPGTVRTRCGSSRHGEAPLLWRGAGTAWLRLLPRRSMAGRRSDHRAAARGERRRGRPAALEAWWNIAMAAQMTDAHRRFLQVLMSHGIMEGSEARKLHRCCCEIHKVYYAHDKLDDFISTINSHLQPLFMQIRKGMSESDGRAHYALVNLTETEITKMASDYAENELELFRKTMDLIVISEDGFASSTDILNLADQLKTKKMKKKEAEQVLKVFVEDKWLSERNGEYTLHTRCIIEMEQYILSNYQDTARKCNICHSLAIQSQVCESCGIGMHLPCVRKYFRDQSEPRCPQCNAFWSCDIPGMRRIDCPSSSKTGRAEKSFILSTRRC